MSTSVLNLSTAVSLDDFATLVKTVGREVTILGRGEPGIGKSSAFYTLRDDPMFEGFAPYYFDCALMDAGDLQIAAISNGKYEFIPNAAFVNDRPMLINFDELAKAPRAAIPALAPLLNGEKRIGGFHLHPDSRVFASTNLLSDNVGDVLSGHLRSRVCEVVIRKPNAKEWKVWAIDAGVDPMLIAWVERYPHCLASYTEGDQEDNPYIYNPKRQQAGYICPRSLARASHVIRARHWLAPQAFIGALAGTIGEAGARDMQAFIPMADALPDWTRIIASPDTCPVPEEAIAQSILVLTAVQSVDRASFTPWLKYLQRLQKEVQALFASQILSSKHAAMAATNGEFTHWAIANAYMH